MNLACVNTSVLVQNTHAWCWTSVMSTFSNTLALSLPFLFKLPSTTLFSFSPSFFFFLTYPLSTPHPYSKSLPYVFYPPSWTRSVTYLENPQDQSHHTPSSPCLWLRAVYQEFSFLLTCCVIASSHSRLCERRKHRCFTSSWLC